MPNPFDPPTDLESEFGPPRYEEFAPDEPLLALAAKQVAEGRQHGCHYAEGTCPECLAIAERVLRAIFPENPPLGALEWMARAHSPRLWNEIEKQREDVSRAYAVLGLREGEMGAMGKAYQAMPVWRVLWGK